MRKAHVLGRGEGVTACRCHCLATDRPNHSGPSVCPYRRRFTDLWEYGILSSVQKERCPSGRRCLTRNQVYSNVPWVRIPPSPPEMIRLPRTSPEAFYTIKKPAPKIDAGFFLLFLLHQALGDHPDRFAIGGDEVVHLGGDEVIVGLIGVSFEFLRVL